MKKIKTLLANLIPYRRGWISPETFQETVLALGEHNIMALDNLLQQNQLLHRIIKLKEENQHLKFQLEKARKVAGIFSN
ncbi:MAG: hypothetical protein V4714_21355 [Bacteroidota bacterium]